MFESRQARHFGNALNEGEFMTKADKGFLFWLHVGAACLALGVISAGCADTSRTNAARPVTRPQPSEMEPAPSQFGPGSARIVSVNPELRFVVIDFSSRVMPPVGTRLNVYRGDKNTGAVQITEPVRAQLATADILQGDVRIGDEAR